MNKNNDQEQRDDSLGHILHRNYQTINDRTLETEQIQVSLLEFLVGLVYISVIVHTLVVVYVVPFW